MEKSTPYRNAWYRDLLEKEKELKALIDTKGNTNSIHLTESEYNALPDDEKMNGTVYFLDDVAKIYVNGISYGGGGMSFKTSINNNRIITEVSISPATRARERSN